MWRSCHCRREIDINESAHIKRHLLIIPQDAVVIPIENGFKRGMPCWCMQNFYVFPIKQKFLLISSVFYLRIDLD